MKGFFQRHSGARKPTNDSTPTYQVWLPPAVDPNDERTRHRTTQDSLDSTVNAHRTGENHGLSRTPQVTEVHPIPYVASSGYNYTTYPSSSRDYHMPTHTQVASTAFASVATPSYPDPGQYLNGSVGWSTSQRPPAPMRPPPEMLDTALQHAPTVHKEDDARRRRRSGDRYKNTDKGKEREQRTRERDADIARYKARVTERYSQKDYIQHRDRDEDRRRAFEEDRERRDGRRNRERRNRDKEKGSESDRDRDRAREQNQRRERSRVHEREKEYTKAHRERERNKDRNLDRGQPTERDADREIARNLRKEREQDEPKKQEKDNLNRKGKARGKDDDSGNLAKEHRLNGKGPGANTGRYGTGGISEDLREGHPYVIPRHREKEGEFNQRRQHDRVSEPDQRERRRDVRKDRDNYLDRRFEPENADWNSASIFNSQPKIQHRHAPAHDETASDNSPRKDSLKLSKHKRNPTDVEVHLSMPKRRDSVPSAPLDPALAHTRQVTSTSNLRENKAGYANLNPSSLPFVHHGKNFASVDQLSRVDPTLSLGEIGSGRSRYKEYMTGSNTNNATMELSLAPSADALLTYNDVQPNSNPGRAKYDEISNSLSSAWPFSKKRSTSGPFTSLVDNTSFVGRVEDQKLEKQPDHTIIMPKAMHSSASQQAALRKVEPVITTKYLTRNMEKHSKHPSTDASKLGSSGPTVDHQEPPLLNQNTYSIPSLVSPMTYAQPSAVRGTHMESHWHRPETNNISQPACLQTSITLDVMQQSSQVYQHQQTSQVLSPYVSRVPSDSPTIDISRKRTESTGSKDRALTVAHSIRETPKVPYAVPSNNHSSIPSRTVASNGALRQVESKAQEVAEGIPSQFQSQDTFPSVSNHMQSDFSTPVEVGINGSIAQSLAAPPLLRQTPGDSPQLHTSFGSIVEPSVSQDVFHPSIVANNMTEHKVTQQLPIRPTALPDTQIVDITINSRISSTPDIRTHLPPSQQGQTGPSPSMEITSFGPRTPMTSGQTSSTEYLPQNACRTRTHRTLLDNALRPERQTSQFCSSSQDASVNPYSEARALPTSVQSSSAVVLNKSADYPQKISTGILDQWNQPSTNIADQTSIHTCTTTHDQPLRHPEMTETGTTPSGVHSIHQTLVQRRMTETRGMVHSEDLSNPLATSIDVKAMAPKISSQSSFIPSSSNENLYQVSSPSNQAVHHVHGLVGSSIETTSNAKTLAFPSDLSTSVTAAKVLQTERPCQFDIDITPSSVLDTNHINSRYANTKAGDIGEVVTSSVGGPIIDVTSMPQNIGSSDLTPSDGPSRCTPTEILAWSFGDGKCSVIQGNLPAPKSNVPKPIPEYETPSIPNKAQPDLQILRPSTAAGYRQINGQGSIPLSPVATDVPNEDKILASVIHRPATAMSSRHHRSERSRIHDVVQASSDPSRPLALLQSCPTRTNDALTPISNPAILSTVSTNKSDVLVPVNAEGVSYPSYKMQLQGQQSFPKTTPDSKPELPQVAKKEVPTLGIHGAPVVQGPRGDVPVIQNHMTYNNTLTPIRGDKNAPSSGQNQPTGSVNRAITTPQPIQNARLAELLSNPAPLHKHILPPETVSDVRDPRAVTSRPDQFTVTRPSTEQPMTRLTQPELAPLNQTRGSLEKHSHEVDSRAPTVQKSTRSPEQSLQNHTAPSRGMLVPTSRQSVPGYDHTFPPIVESTFQSRTNQDSSVASKPQKLVTSRSGNHGSSAIHASQQETQTHPYTNSRSYDQNKAPHKDTVEPISWSQSLPLSNPLSLGTTHTSSHHQTSQRTARSKDHSNTFHKHTPNTQLVSSHATSGHTIVSPNSLANNDPPAPAVHIPSYQQSRVVSSTRDHDHPKPSHKLAVTSSAHYLVPSFSTSRPYAPSTQRTETARDRSRSTAPINNPPSSQIDFTPNRYVSSSSSQVPQSSLQTNVSVPSQSVSSSVKPRTTPRNNAKAATRSSATACPSESRSDQPGSSAPDSKIRTSAPTNTFQSRSDATLQQSIPMPFHLPDPASSRYNREMSHRPYEDSVLLKTPSSLAPTILKPSTSRTSIPASFSSQTSSRKRGLFSIFRSKASQTSDQAEEPQKSAPRKLRKESKTKADNFSEAVAPQDIKVTSAVSSRAKAPPISVPIPIPPVTERKSPNRVFTPFRYLTTKRNRRVSQASLEAQDGTAPNTVLGSPTASIHSTHPPIQPPPLRDVFAATQEWRHMEAAEVREVTGGKLRRARPGVVFDVAEDHTEEDRPKIKPQSRQS